MTIKRRLFISNILMIILPIFFTMAMSFAMYSAFVGITGIDPIPIRQGGFSIVKDSRAAEIVQSPNYKLLEHDIALYRSDSGALVMVLPENMSTLTGAEIMPYHVPLIMFISLLLIVLLTNYILTRLITRSIMSSLDTLVNGVHEISDGNLRNMFCRASLPPVYHCLPAL